MTQLFIIAFPGTTEVHNPSAKPTGPLGMLKAIADVLPMGQLNAQWLTVQYPAVYAGWQSYVESVREGYRRGKLLIERLPADCKYVVIGYSQGGHVGGHLAHDFFYRDPRFLHYYGVADPFHDPWSVQIGNLGGEGILFPENTRSQTFCASHSTQLALPGDVITNANPKKDLFYAIAKISNEANLADPRRFFQKIEMDIIQNRGGLRKELEEGLMPFFFKSRTTFDRTVRYLETGIHTQYGQRFIQTPAGLLTPCQYVAQDITHRVTTI